MRSKPESSTHPKMVRWVQAQTKKNITTWARYNNPNVASVNGGINFANYQMIGKVNTVLQEIAEQGMDIAVANIKVDNVKEKGKDALASAPTPCDA